MLARKRPDGLVNGETVEFKAVGSQTKVGESDNAYKIEWSGTAKRANYRLEAEIVGKLTVSAQSIDPDDAGAFGGVTVGYLNDTVYNGADQRFEPEVVDKDGKVLVKGRDYELSYSGDVKNVGEVIVIVAGKGNYAGSVERAYRIAPAPLTVTTGSDSKIYDGSELVNGKLTIEGLQGEDRVTAATTGSQTEVGSSENTYRITWGRCRCCQLRHRRAPRHVDGHAGSGAPGAHAHADSDPGRRHDAWHDSGWHDARAQLVGFGPGACGSQPA